MKNVYLTKINSIINLQLLCKYYFIIVYSNLVRYTHPVCVVDFVCILFSYLTLKCTVSIHFTFSLWCTIINSHFITVKNVYSCYLWHVYLYHSPAQLYGPDNMSWRPVFTKCIVL